MRLIKLVSVLGLVLCVAACGKPQPGPKGDQGPPGVISNREAVINLI